MIKTLIGCDFKKYKLIVTLCYSYVFLVVFILREIDDPCNPSVFRVRKGPQANQDQGDPMDFL